MRLPHLDSARIGREKILGYLLALDHPEGSSKARFLIRAGFSAEEWVILESALMEHARCNPVVEEVRNPYGRKFRIEGPLSCPDGRTPYFRTIWILDVGSTIPRLVTAHPLR